MAEVTHSNDVQVEQENLVEQILARKFTVVFHNDDFTPMEFVVLVLRNVFGLNEDAAVATMMKIHQEGKGAAGVFSREIADTKVDISTRAAVHAGHPFHCEVQPI